MKKSNIIWDCIKVSVPKIKPTPNNFKLFDEEGAAVFRNSLDSFGKAGSVIINKDYTLIDGNTRWKDAVENKEKFLWASIPSRLLTAKEFNVMSAIFDRARAGQVDTLRISEEWSNQKGNTKSFFKAWGIPMPEEVLKKLEDMENGVITPDKKKITEKEIHDVDVMPITLIFTPAEHKKYMEIAESLYKRFKVDNVTDLTMKAMIYVKKN